MRNTLIITILTLTILGCSKGSDDPKNNIPTELIGKWKITHQYIAAGSGANGSWNELDTGKNYDLWLKDDGTFSTEDNENCTTCEFYISDNKLYLSTNNGDSPGTIMDLTENFFILWWADFEGFGYKYAKVEN